MAKQNMYCTSCGSNLGAWSKKSCPRCGSPLHALSSDAQSAMQTKQENVPARVSAFSAASAFARQHGKLIWLVIFIVSVAAPWWGLNKGQTHVPNQLSVSNPVSDTPPSPDTSTSKAVSSEAPILEPKPVSHITPNPPLTAAEIIASKDVEYYRNFSENTNNPFDETPFSLQEKITKEEAEKSDLYFIAKKNKEKRISAVLKIKKGQCIFHNRYTYKSGSLVSVRKLVCNLNEPLAPPSPANGRREDAP